MGSQSDRQHLVPVWPRLLGDLRLYVDLHAEACHALRLRG